MKNIIISLSTFWLCVCSCFALDDQYRIYTGSISVPSMGELGMSLSISDNENGISLHMTVPSQGTENLPLETTFNANGEMIGQFPQAGIVFTVQENENQSSLTGTMQQSGFTFEIDFHRVTALPEMQRPQHPTEPFPYRTREITAIHDEGHLLAGTLTIPEGEGPFPCAVLISGSGQQDRDESLMGHKPFLVIADHLTRNGIAVLRYDDRGVGGSVMEDVSELSDDTSYDFATDALVMVNAARIHPEIDALRVGVIGHSEGGLIGPIVAQNDRKLAYVVMLAGPGMRGLELLPLQQSKILEASGVSQEITDALVHVNLSLFELALADASEEEMMTLIDEAIELTMELEGSLDAELTDEIRKGLVEQLNSEWLRYFLVYDPLPALKQLTCPVLAMNGTLDLQVPSQENLSLIEEAMIGADRDVTIVELEGLNHLFQPAMTGAIAEYAAIETTFDENALQIMSDWVAEVTDHD